MSHKSEAKYSNITKDRLIYNKTGHVAILVNRRGVCKIFENGGVPGADPGFRRGGGGVRTFRRGGFVQEFQERIQIVAGPWANQQAKQIADSRRGGVRSPEKKTVSAPGPFIELHRPKSGPKYIYIYDDGDGGGGGGGGAWGGGRILIHSVYQISMFSSYY